MTGIGSAYDAAAGLWAVGPERLYAPAAKALVAAVGPDVAGSRVLDLGAGTGVAGRAALRAAASGVVAADLSASLLHRCPPRVSPVVADALALPFADHSFDVVLAAFALSHLPDLHAGLVEVRRVGAMLAASSFAPGWSHPAKPAVDAVLHSFGHLPPAWYTDVKERTEPAAADPTLLTTAVEAVGYRHVAVTELMVKTDVQTPVQLAAWRLGMAHVAPFVRDLVPEQRAELVRAAQLSVAGLDPLVVRMQVLIAT